jgi:hypothetical protein
MKRLSSLLALALTASLLAAPAALAQPKTTPAPAPAPAAQPDKTPAKPAKDDKPTPSKTDKPAPKSDAPAGDDKSKAFEDANKPGPNHKMLEQLKGEWAAEVKDLTPGQETTDKGTMTCEVVFGGRFLTMDFDGRSHGKFFKGGGMMGYNNQDKRFEATWADSMSTGIMFMTGSSSNDGKTFTLTGEMPNPMTGKKSTWKEVIAITAKDAWHDDFYMVDGGKEMKVMEISYPKAGKGEKKDDMKTPTP